VLASLGEKLGLDPLTRKFLGVLAQNRRVIELPAVIRAFQAIAAAQRGEVTAEVASAHALTDDQVTALEQKLRAREGRTVKLKTNVDPDLLGGLVVTIGSRRIDTSIRTRLNSLAQAMKG
jgi:F-type H+-transporting ATPase subunit delta